MYCRTISVRLARRSSICHRGEYADRGIELGDLPVETDVAGPVVTLEAVGSEVSHTLGQPVVSSGDKSAFARCHDLGSAETEDLCVAEPTNLHPAVLASVTVRRVEDEIGAMFSGDPAQLFDVAWVPEDVSGQYDPRLRKSLHLGAEGRWRHVVGRAVHIYQDRG